MLTLYRGGGGLSKALIILGGVNLPHLRILGRKSAILTIFAKNIIFDVFVLLENEEKKVKKVITSSEIEPKSAKIG